MKIILTLFFAVMAVRVHSQVKISEILAYEYNNQKNKFSPNVVGKESSDVEGSGNQTMIVIRLNRIPGSHYKYVNRKLKVIAQIEGDGKVEVVEIKELTIPYVDETFYVPLIIQKGATELTIKAELFEEGKSVSTKKQLLLKWSGD